MGQQTTTRATIFDVAQRASVSIKTVSRVVNREPNVRDKTRQKVEQAIAELQYRPDSSARNLARQRSHLIGLVYDDPAAYELPSSGYIIRMQQGALRACRDRMHELLIHPCNPRERGVGATLRNLIESARLAGVVLAPPLSNMTRLVRAIQETGTPFVRISPGLKVRNDRCVATNDLEISADMVDHLASLGHQRIAFISGDDTHLAVGNRYDGYKEGLRRNGLKLAPELIAAGDNSFDSGGAAARQLLSLKDRPTAVFCANDDMAAGVVRAASKLGVSIPDQISVTGFDDIVMARQMDPRLTTIRQPLARMTERAVQMLLQGETGDLFECIPAELKIRESTGPAPH
ncbi:MAG: LacI family DNA-binding transcriptional regulator [Pseudomonadota bacterium]